MKFEFPYYNIPVIVSDQLLKMDENFTDNIEINGKNYKISKSKKELSITYRINNIIDVFFFALLQVAQAKISLEKNGSQERYCKIEIRRNLRFGWLASLIIFGLVITCLLFLEPKFGVIFLIGLILILFIQYKFFEIAIKYIKSHINMDIHSIMNFINQKAKPST